MVKHMANAFIQRIATNVWGLHRKAASFIVN